MSLVRLLLWLATAAFRALQWFVHEFFPLPTRLVATSTSGSLSRLVGCIVILVVLRAELRDGLLPSIGGVIQFIVAGFTAILLGNIAKEFAFDLYARCVMWSSRSFVRKGKTLGGNDYCEIQFNDGTWMRCEMSSAGILCEWTEPDGRCKRIAVQPARGCRKGADGQPMGVGAPLAVELLAALPEFRDPLRDFSEAIFFSSHPMVSILLRGIARDREWQSGESRRRPDRPAQASSILFSCPLIQRAWRVVNSAPLGA
jgi:hypothetical protein